MLEHGFVHEDVLIKLFKFSLEGNAREWCQSLPAVSIHSLKDFHVAFNSYYEKIYSADLLFLECCHEFNLSKVDIHEDYAAVENTLHYDQEIVYPHHDSHSDAFVIASNASPNLCCHEDKIVPIENLKSEEQIFISARDSFRSATDNRDSFQSFDLQTQGNYKIHNAEDEEDSLPCLDLQGLSSLQLEHVNHDPECVDIATAYVMSSPHLPDLQTKADFSIYEENDGGEELSSPDQQFIGYFSPTDFEQPSPADLEQFIHIIETKEDSQPHHFHLQSEQKLEEVFHYYFIDPIADFLESFSSIKIKIFLSDESCFYHFSRTHLCWLCILSFLGSRLRILSANKFLTWLCWKCAFT